MADDDFERDLERAVEGPVECDCEHTLAEHGRRWFSGVRPCRRCRCRDFEPNVIWRNSHGQPVDPHQPDGMSTQALARLLDMPEDHIRFIEAYRDVMGGFSYDELGVLVITDPDGEELARIV